MITRPIGEAINFYSKNRLLSENSSLQTLPIGSRNITSMACDSMPHKTFTIAQMITSSLNSPAMPERRPGREASLSLVRIEPQNTKLSGHNRKADMASMLFGMTIITIPSRLRQQASVALINGLPWHPAGAAVILKYGFLYQGQWYTWQSQRRGTSTFDTNPAAMIAFLQNHDQIANSARGLRLHELTTSVALKRLPR